MYCKKCGSQIDEDSVFCQNCGEKQSAILPTNETKAYSEESAASVNRRYQNNNIDQEKKKINWHGIIIGVIILLVGLFLMFRDMILYSGTY